MIVSVVMATYNGGSYLAEQLMTLATQSRIPDELVVSDDCSTDDTVRILTEFQARAPFPVIINRNPERVGYSANFSNAVSLAGGDLILFSDQDDHWEPLKIQLVAEWFEARPNKLLAIHNVAICDAELRVEIADYFEHLDRNHARHAFIKGCATAIRRELADAAFPLPAPVNWHHDKRIHAIARVRERHGYIEKVLMKHRVHAQQASGYVVAPKGPGGRLLAVLDQCADTSSPSWARGLRLMPRPHTEASLHEFLDATGIEGLEPKVMLASARMRRRDMLGPQNRCAGGKFVRSTRLCLFYLGGGYRDIGGISQYLADSIRLAKA